MAFPESGRYVVPGALVPVEIDRERDTGRYEEPGVWMRHSLERSLRQQGQPAMTAQQSH
jgi:hypothetical protein